MQLQSNAHPPQAIYGLGGGYGLEPDAPLTDTQLSKLIWRSRRGMLENDLFIERFFSRYSNTLTIKQANALNALMDLSDNQLLDLHLGRKTLAEVRDDLNTPEINAVLALLKEKP